MDDLLALVNGRVYTFDPAQPHATALVARGERIIYVGDDRGARDRLGSGAAPRSSTCAGPRSSPA